MQNQNGSIIKKAQSSSTSLTALPRLLDQRQLAEYLQKSVAWCERARWLGEGPKFIKLGRHIRYRAEDVRAWVESNIRTSTRDSDADSE